MTLRDTAAAVGPKNPGGKCGIRTVRLAVGKDDNDWLDDVLPLNSGKTSTWISEVLRADGHTVSEFTVQRHRRRKCACAPGV